MLSKNYGLTILARLYGIRAAMRRYSTIDQSLYIAEDLWLFSAGATGCLHAEGVLCREA